MSEEDKKTSKEKTVIVSEIVLEEKDGKMQITLGLAQQRDKKGRFQRVINPKNLVVRTTTQGVIVSNILNIFSDFQLKDYWVEIFPNSIFICLGENEIQENEAVHLQTILQDKLSKWIQILKYRSTTSSFTNRHGKRASKEFEITIKE